MGVDRRVFLGVFALAALAAFGSGAIVGAVSAPPPEPDFPRTLGIPRRVPRPLPAAFPMPKRFVPPQLARISLPGGTLYDLPGDGNLLALTVDDGASSEVVAAYTRWLADSGELSDAQLMEFANRWMLAQHIVIGHANFMTVTRHFADLADLIRARGLIPVTLDDVFLRP